MSVLVGLWGGIALDEGNTGLDNVVVLIWTGSDTGLDTWYCSSMGGGITLDKVVVVIWTGSDSSPDKVVLL